MVYVINKQGKALMPSDRHGKVRRLLKSGLAHVVCRIPFTIQLRGLNDDTNNQHITSAQVSGLHSHNNKTSLS